jgi:hypothetical protein
MRRALVQRALVSLATSLSSPESRASDIGWVAATTCHTRRRARLALTDLPSDYWDRTPTKAPLTLADAGSGSRVWVGDAAVGVEVALFGVGECVEVFLGGLDKGVAHAVHHGAEVGAAGEEPGGVGVP